MLLFVFSNCNDQEKEIDISQINGYWEIDHVITTDGNTKSFNFNEFIDVFKTTKNSGFRAKVKPNFNGIYKGNNQKINYLITKRNDSVFMDYKTTTNTWSDLVIEASEKQICIKNKQGILYYYRPYTPIIIE